MSPKPPDDEKLAIIRSLSYIRTREDAITALQKYGDSAIAALKGNLNNRSNEMILRRAVVEALARIGSVSAVQVLTEELVEGPGELDAEIIDALDRIHSKDPGIPLSAAVARRKTISLIKRYCQTFIDLHGLESGEGNADLRHQLTENLEIYFANIFKLLGLYYPREDIHRAYQNLKKGTESSVGYAIEVLDNILNRDVREAVLLLVEDLTLSDKTKRLQEIIKDFSDI